MKVSIITVTYNSQAYLQECIDSVAKQDYRDIEYIVIDGASKDGTVQLIKKNDSKISRWITEPDAGIYDAINKGIALATGDLVGVLNSDDFFADNGVVSRIVHSVKTNGSDIVYADVEFIGEDYSSIRHYSSRLFRPWMFRFGFQPAHPTFYTFRKHFGTIGNYNRSFKIAGDFELLLRFLFKERLAHNYIKDTWVKMRPGGASTSGLDSVIRLNKEILRACQINNVHTNYLLIYSKYLFKWWGFIFRK